MENDFDTTGYPYCLTVEPSKFSDKEIEELCDILDTKQYRYNKSMFYFKTEVDKFDFFMKYC